MRNGDISNRQAPIILFRVEDLLVKSPSPKNLKEKVVTKLLGEHHYSELDRSALDTIHYIYRDTDCTSELVCLESEWVKYPTHLRREIKEDLPISNLHICLDDHEVDKLLERPYYTHYVDNVESRLPFINHRKSVTLHTLRVILSIGGM